MAANYKEEWEGQPMVRVADVERVAAYVPPPVEEWCSCGSCHGWPQRNMNTCCRDHPIWQTRRDGIEIRCITECANIEELMKHAPLRSQYFSYCAAHKPKLPDAEGLVADGQLITESYILRRRNEQKRLCAYRSIVFWIYPFIRKKERKPLPACIYAMVRAMFPSTTDEEAYADWQHSVFTYEAAADE